MNGSWNRVLLLPEEVGEHPMFDDKGRVLLTSLGAAKFLFHLLRCAECRDVALADLGETLDVVAGPWPEPRPSVSSRAQAEAEGLLAELMTLAPEARSEALGAPRFHSLTLLDVLLEQAEEAGRMNALRDADSLAWLAIELASAVKAEDAWLHSRLSRAYCLAGSARRLGGDLQAAESAFDNGALFLTGSLGRGLYCRDLALLRWDQGRLEDAAALLRQGAAVLGERGGCQDEATCLALLGLLHVEQGLVGSALGPLRRAWPRVAFGPPWLAGRALAALGACFAAHGQEEEAWEAAGQASSYRRSGEASEMPLLRWLEGKMMSYLGDLTQAWEELDAARGGLLAHHRWIEAGLVSLDLAAVYTEAGRGEQIGRLKADLDRAGTGLGAAKAAADVLAHFDETVASTRVRATLLGSHLLQMARVRRLGAPSLPWV